MSLRHKIPFRTGELPVDNLGLEIDSRGQALIIHAGQSGNMAIVLTSLLFVFEISILPKYGVNYYDYTIKWCFGI